MWSRWGEKVKERRERRTGEGGRDDKKKTSAPTAWKEMCTIVVSYSFFDSLSGPLPVNEPAALFWQLIIRAIVFPDSGELTWHTFERVLRQTKRRKHKQRCWCRLLFLSEHPHIFLTLNITLLLRQELSYKEKYVGFPSPGPRNAEAELGQASTEDRIQGCARLFIGRNKEKKQQRKEATAWHQHLPCVYVCTV